MDFTFIEGQGSTDTVKCLDLSFPASTDKFWCGAIMCVLVLHLQVP